MGEDDMKNRSYEIGCGVAEEIKVKRQCVE